eukprot:5404610-Pyramimonas_sp.AAC.1
MRIDGRHAPKLTVDVVLRARAKLNEGKAPGGNLALSGRCLPRCPSQSVTFCRSERRVVERHRHVLQ